MRCATHPDVETNLRCGKCGKPICPRCLVQTPVGARCRECARLYTLPTYRVSVRFYLRAAGAALGMAVVTGLLWGLISGIMPFFYLNLLMAAAVGYTTGEAISLSVNRKRSKGLAAIAGIAVTISYLLSAFFLGRPLFGIHSLLFDLLALGLGIFVAANRLY